MNNRKIVKGFDIGTPDDLRQALQSLRGYLQDLLETGVDTLPLLPAGETGRFHTAAIEEFPVSAAGQLCGIVAETSKADYHGGGSRANVNGGGYPEAISDIAKEVERCRRCSLWESRTKPVFGTGNHKARLIFVGEAPGRDEDLQGVPFVGRAGELLTSMTGRMGLSRDDVYICNVLKCRPPNNRNPLPDEIESCTSYLLRQLEVIRPEAIIALGTFASQTLLATKEPISRLRGRFHEYQGIPLMPTFHPSFLLRNGPEMRWLVWEDMVKVMELLGMAVPEIKKKR
ncbi:MAG: uracil-DNA glycosylase [Deltaproteobacteria bacterium]